MCWVGLCSFCTFQVKLYSDNVLFCSVCMLQLAGKEDCWRGGELCCHSHKVQKCCKISVLSYAPTATDKCCSPECATREMYFAVCTLQQICWGREINLSQEQCAWCHLFWIAICRAAAVVRHASMQQFQCLGTEISSRGNQVLLIIVENPKISHFRLQKMLR